MIRGIENVYDDNLNMTTHDDSPTTDPTPDGPFREKIASLPPSPGVYIFLDETGQVLYVGKAKHLNKRVRQYFHKSRAHDLKTMEMLARACDLSIVECASETEAFLVENRMIKDLQPPFNIQQKSQATFPFVEITWGEDFPRVLVTRDRSNAGSTYYGPFTSASKLRKALALLQPIFKFRTCTLDIVESDKKWDYFRPCMEHLIDRCKAPCNRKISKEEYRAGMRRFVRAVSGGVKELKKDLADDMAAASAARRYEDAAELRDMIIALDSLDRRGSVDDTQTTPAWLHIDPKAGCEKLAAVFKLKMPVRVIEGIDIAHLQGESTVGSLVSFIDGQPNKPEYRRYRIKSHTRNDDYASIAEVVSRRYKRLADENKPLPDIVLIDGGIGQLHAAANALKDAGVAVPFLCSLAKHDEIVFTLAHPDGLKLSRRNAALRLLMHVRDEAHRFAQHYHHILRKKQVFGDE